MVYYDRHNCLYLFGGLNELNQTLNDMWRFDIGGQTWREVTQYGDVPRPRSGHSFSINLDEIYMFGGLIEVTNESDELFKFDLTTNSWTLIYGSE
jgi:N-acetylneuraminic acid mutarotase